MPSSHASGEYERAGVTPGSCFGVRAVGNILNQSRPNSDLPEQRPDPLTGSGHRDPEEATHDAKVIQRQLRCDGDDRHLEIGADRLRNCRRASKARFLTLNAERPPRPWKTSRSPRPTESPCGSRSAPWWASRGRWWRRRDAHCRLRLGNARVDARVMAPSDRVDTQRHA